MARLPDGELMARAATGLAVHCLRLLRSRPAGVPGSRAAVLCGAGNNGGDALYAAARLAARGVAVTAVLLAPDAVHQGGLAALRAAGGRAIMAEPLEPAVAATRAADLVLDGIVGIGGRGGLRPTAAALARAADGSDGLMVAVDLPSGVDPDTGEVVGEAVRADVTVTFGCLKSGPMVGEGRQHSGEIRLVDIGLDDDLRGTPVLESLTDADVAARLPMPRPSDSKYTRGVLGLLAGSAAYPGAAVLAAGGALAAGVGMVRMVSVGPVVDEVRHRYPSVVCTRVPERGGFVADPDAALGAGRVQAWVVGPGLGTSDAVERVLAAVLGQDVPVLIDADALTVLSRARLERPAGAETLLTPHDGEFVRLRGEDSAQALVSNRVAAATDAAAALGATVLLKGHTTVVAQAAEPALVNVTGSPWLASAGSGDVLSGVAGALLATGESPRMAGAMAAHVHGLGARRVGGGSSNDLAGAIQDVLADLRGVTA